MSTNVTHARVFLASVALSATLCQVHLASAADKATATEQTQRQINDSDKDGLDDIWAVLFRDTPNLHDKNADSDGDGRTNYEEMLDFTNPGSPDKKPKPATPEEQRAADKAAKEHAAQADARRREALKQLLEEGRQTALRALPASAAPAERSRALQAADQAATGKKLNDSLQLKAKNAREALKDPKARDILTGPTGAGTIIGIENGLPQIDAPDNSVAADTIGTDELWPGGTSPLPDLTGAGRTFGIWEARGGPLTTHVEFAATGGGSRIVQQDNPLAETLFALWPHATQVAGTLVAGGSNTLARGMSFGANLRAYAAVGDTGEMATEAAAGMRVSNHSYSRVAGWLFNASLPTIGGQPAPPWLWNGPDIVGEDPNFGHYGPTSRQIDLVVYDARRYLPCWSSGNEVTDTGPAAGAVYWRVNGANISTSNTAHPPDGGANGAGFDTLKQQSTAKNNLVVGAVADIPGGYTAVGQVLITNFSSAGPTDDGRIKPDMVADGMSFLTAHYEVPSSGAPATNLYTDGSTTARAAVSGTSFATPSVAATINLLQQLQEQLGGSPLWASLWKALCINMASDAGFTDGGPDYFHGWGLFNARASADLVSANAGTPSMRSHLRQHCLFNGQTIEIVVECDGTRPLRVTIAWTDPAFQTTATAGLDGGILATPATADPVASMLTNDVDVRIVRPGGAIAQPWILNPATPNVAAARGDNTRDNVEQVFINDASGNAPAGTYIIRITHKGTLRVANQTTPGNYNLTTTDGRQQVGVAISGNRPRPADAHAISFFERLSNTHLCTWNSNSGVRYQTESSTNLQTWTPVLTPVNAIGTATTLAIPVSGPPAALYYRVRELGVE
jgi:Subtilase family